jgi:hypothetical protein
LATILAFVGRNVTAAGARRLTVDAASHYLRVYFDVIGTTQSWSDLQAEMQRTASASWVRHVPRPRTDREATWAPAAATLDPAAILRNVGVPIVAVHGAEDVDVPAIVNSALR